MKKPKKTGVGMSNLLISAAILALWQQPVAFSEALDLLNWAMHGAMYRCIVMAIKTTRKVGVFFCRCFVCCCPGSCWGIMEQVVAQWQHPVASRVALDMLHWAIQAALHPRIRMAIKMACDRGAFVHYCHFWLDTTHS
jgi:hypothetical protein